MPPALVAIMPPMVALPRAAISMPGMRPTSAVASCKAWSVTPAPTVTVRARGSMASIRSRRAVERMSSPGRLTPPPTSPVRPPCGTTGTSFLMHQRTTAAAASGVAGTAMAPAPKLPACSPGCRSASRSPPIRWSASPKSFKSRSSDRIISDMFPFPLPMGRLECVVRREGGIKQARGSAGGNGLTFTLKSINFRPCHHVMRNAGKVCRRTARQDFPHLS